MADAVLGVAMGLAVSLLIKAVFEACNRIGCHRVLANAVTAVSVSAPAIANDDNDGRLFLDDTYLSLSRVRAIELSNIPVIIMLTSMIHSRDKTVATILRLRCQAVAKSVNAKNCCMLNQRTLQPTSCMRRLVAARASTDSGHMKN
eukprot:6208485-Pleurochrysis_carterae.AAC.1